MCNAYLNLALIAAVGIDNGNSGVFVFDLCNIKPFNFFRFFKAANGAGSFPFAAFKNRCLLCCYPLTEGVRCKGKNGVIESVAAAVADIV